MSSEQLVNIYHLNKSFLQHLLKVCQLTENPISAIPSFVFLLFAFIFFHGVLHRRTWLHTPFKVRFYREVGFQWTFFYLLRMWMACIRTTHWLIVWFESYLKLLHSKEEILWITSLHIRALCLSVLICISLIPFAIVIATCMYQQDIPNFLMWVGEDPWVRSEIGIAGHYLERPPNFVFPRRKEYAYRSRRSMSVEHPLYKRVKLPVRNCKSLEALM